MSSIGLTQKQEAFCRAITTEANDSDALRLAYNCTRMKKETINRKAHSLKQETKISARIAQLQAEAAARHAVTVDSLVEELVASRAMAAEERNPSAMTQATLAKARITGNINDSVTLKGEWSQDKALKYFRDLGIEPKLITH